MYKLLFTFIAILIMICRSSSAQSDHSRTDNQNNDPLFNFLLPDKQDVDVYEVNIDSSSVLVKYGYLSDNNDYLTRIIKIDDKMNAVALYDENGLPVTGFMLSDEDKEKQKLSLLLGDGAVTMTADFENEKDVTLKLTGNNKTDKIKFDDFDELDSCLSIYDQVLKNNLSQDQLSKHERKMYKKAEMICNWVTDIDSFSFDKGILPGKKLVESKEFRKWLKENYEF